MATEKTGLSVPDAIVDAIQPRLMEQGIYLTDNEVAVMVPIILYEVAETLRHAPGVARAALSHTSPEGRE